MKFPEFICCCSSSGRARRILCVVDAVGFGVEKRRNSNSNSCSCSGSGDCLVFWVEYVGGKEGLDIGP